MRNEDDGPASLALAADHVEHALGEVGGQRRRHLVEQQHVGFDRERAGEVEHALDRQRHVARGVAQVEVGHAELVHPVAERLDGRLCKAQIGQHVEIGDQRRLLIDGNKAGLAGAGGRADVTLLAAQEDAAGIGRNGSGEDLDQRRLAGAVGAHQRMHFAGQHRQRRVLQRGDGAVVFRDAGGVEDRFSGQID